MLYAPVIGFEWLTPRCLMTDEQPPRKKEEGVDAGLRFELKIIAAELEFSGYNFEFKSEASIYPLLLLAWWLLISHQAAWR